MTGDLDSHRSAPTHFLQCDFGRDRVYKGHQVDSSEVLMERPSGKESGLGGGQG